MRLIDDYAALAEINWIFLNTASCDGVRFAIPSSCMYQLLWLCVTSSRLQEFFYYTIRTKKYTTNSSLFFINREGVQELQSWDNFSFVYFNGKGWFAGFGALYQVVRIMIQYTLFIESIEGEHVNPTIEFSNTWPSARAQH